MKHNKAYIILGVDKDGKYYGYCDGFGDTMINTERVHVTANFKWNFERLQYYRNMLDFEVKKCRKELNYAKRHNKRLMYHEDTVIKASRLEPNSNNQLEWFYLRLLAQRLTKENFKGCTWKVYRANSKECPVTVDMTEYMDMRKKKIPYNKYNYWNHKFTVK